MSFEAINFNNVYVSGSNLSLSVTKVTNKRDHHTYYVACSFHTSKLIELEPDAPSLTPEL